MKGFAIDKSAVGTSVGTDTARVLVAIPYSLTTLKCCQAEAVIK